jgi:cell division protein FtsN
MLARVLFVLLLALNIGAAAWLLLRPTAPMPVMAASDPQIPSLVLLTERDQGAMAQAAELAQAPESSAPRQCLRIGPFKKKEAVEAALRALEADTKSAQVQQTVESTPRGFWVYIPPANARAEALATARQLAQAGVRDYYVVTAGRQENHISLGLFRDRANAEKRKGELNALGFSARVSERTTESEAFWLEVESKAGEAISWQTKVADADQLSERAWQCGKAP